MEEFQDQVMKISQWVERFTRWILQRVYDSKSCCVNCDLYPANGGAVIFRGDRPDRRRPAADAPAFSYDAGDVLPLAVGVRDFVGRPLSEGIYYVAVLCMVLRSFERGKKRKKKMTE